MEVCANSVVVDLRKGVLEVGLNDKTDKESREALTPKCSEEDLNDSVVLGEVLPKTRSEEDLIDSVGEALPKTRSEEDLSQKTDEGSGESLPKTRPEED